MRRTALSRGSTPLRRVPPLSRSKGLRKVGKRGKAIREALAILRGIILDRDDYTCRRCLDPRSQPLDVHHRLARSQGGTHSPANLVTLCRACHDAVTFGTPPDRARWVETRRGA